MNNVYYTKEESLDMLEKLLSKKFKKLNLRKTGSFYDDNLVTITKKGSYEDENVQIKLLDNVNSIAVLMNNKAYIESGIDHMIFEITLFSDAYVFYAYSYDDGCARYCAPMIISKKIQRTFDVFIVND